MSKTIETEYKLEVSADEFEGIQERLANLGYSFDKSSALEDYFFDIERFDTKGYNFKRIRVYDSSVYEQTTKKWRMIENGDRVRDEEESIVTKDILDLEISKGSYLYLKKERTDYSGTLFGFQAVFSLDKVYITGRFRFFIECELKEVPEEQSKEFRMMSRDWMLENLALSGRPEGIGMMRMVIEASENV